MSVINHHHKNKFVIFILIHSGFSPYFKTMFDPQSKYAESISRKIVVTDFEYEVVLQMLEFIYTGKAPKMAEMTAELMKIADKVYSES